ncbi:hypothetical protein [Vibrio owensii]|uniref:hypothetical protein n=1 Tax=Vibrio harveyi group TaxID=717610 RepID=UPI003CC61E43
MKLEEIWAKKLNTEIVSEIGSGDFGTAFETSNGRVIKITRNVQEACCSALAMSESTRHITPVHAVQRFAGGQYGVYMDLLEEDFNLDWAFQELDLVCRETGWTYKEIDIDFFEDYEALQDMNLSEEALELLEAIDNYVSEAKRLGFEPEDIKFANTGIDSSGVIRFYDHLYRSANFDEQYLLTILAEKSQEHEQSYSLEI